MFVKSFAFSMACEACEAFLQSFTVSVDKLIDTVDVECWPMLNVGRVYRFKTFGNDAICYNHVVVTRSYRKRRSNSKPSDQRAATGLQYK